MIDGILETFFGLLAVVLAILTWLDLHFCLVPTPLAWKVLLLDFVFVLIGAIALALSLGVGVFGMEKGPELPIGNEMTRALLFFSCAQIIFSIGLYYLKAQLNSRCGLALGSSDWGVRLASVALFWIPGIGLIRLVGSFKYSP
jgi:hypothetical protein